MNLQMKSLEELEKEHIVAVLAACEGNKQLAATVLGVSIKTLYNKLLAYGMYVKVKDRKSV